MSAERGKTKATGNLRLLVDPKLASALAHPLRIHILDVLSEAIASPSDLARGAGISVNYVAYHVKELEKIGYVELVKTEPRRGTVEHYYRASRRFMLDDGEWDQLPPLLRRAFSANICKALIDDMREALAAGTFDAREGSHVSRTKLFVDERGWSDLAEALAETLERVLEIQAECTERLQEGEDQPIPVAVQMAGFETPPRADL